MPLISKTFEIKKQLRRAAFLSNKVSSKRDHVDRTELPAVLRVGSRIERHLLPLLQRVETVHLNGGVMHENVVSPFVVGNKAVALSIVEPFHCPVHNVTS